MPFRVAEKPFRVPVFLYDGESFSWGATLVLGTSALVRVPPSVARSVTGVGRRVGPPQGAGGPEGRRRPFFQISPRYGSYLSGRPRAGYTREYSPVNPSTKVRLDA